VRTGPTAFGLEALLGWFEADSGARVINLNATADGAASIVRSASTPHGTRRCSCG
jgi:hypothetical protein